MAIWHYLFVIPLCSGRSVWIAAKTGVSLSAVSFESCAPGVDLFEFVRRLRRVYVAPASCGVCGSVIGKYVPGDDALVYDRDRGHAASVFNFRCGSPQCGALCGVTTCDMNTPPARHVLSKHN